MIQIAGSQLCQWDVGRSVNISDSKATHVHLANQGDSKAVIIEITNGTAKIPDYLLQTSKALNAYAVLDGVTLESRSFAVCKRERPENYVYEDDRRNYIYELITSAEDAVENANQAAQNANEAAEKLGSIVIPTKVSQLENDSGFLTEAPVTSVNGQTGDVILPPPVMVTVSKREDGTYEADRTYSELKAAREAGITLLCRYYDEDVYLPFASWHGVFTFCAVVDNVSYQISISTREQVFFQKTELITDLTGYATEGYVDEAIEGIAIEGIPEAITPPDTATVGQTIVVKEVDENGKPILWEAAGFPVSGAANDNPLELISDITLEEDVGIIIIEKDDNGEPFELENFMLETRARSSVEGTSTGNVNGHVIIGGQGLQNCNHAGQQDAVFNVNTMYRIFNSGLAVFRVFSAGATSMISPTVFKGLLLEPTIKKITLKNAGANVRYLAGSSIKLYGRRVKK